MSEKITLEEENLAAQIYVALIGNPERYKHISKLMGDNYQEKHGAIVKGITQEQANEKNRNKAVKLAKYFYANPNLTRE